MKTPALRVINQKAAYSEVTKRLAEYLNGECTKDELEMVIKAVNCVTTVKMVQIKEGLAKTEIERKAVLIEDVEMKVGTSIDPEAPHYE
jgi:hypothetical protein